MNDNDWKQRAETAESELLLVNSARAKLVGELVRSEAECQALRQERDTAIEERNAAERIAVARPVFDKVQAENKRLSDVLAKNPRVQQEEFDLINFQLEEVKREAVAVNGLCSRLSAENISLNSELTTAREETRRAERDWTKALAERDDARAELKLARASVSSSEEALRQTDTELATVRAELANAQDCCERRQKAENELSTTRAALSTLEQAAWEAVWSWNGYRLYGREIDKWGDMTALERALNEVSK